MGAVALALLLTATGCGRRDSAWQAVQSSGVLRVGIDATYPPFENVAPDGSLAGFDVDLATEIGERLGVEIEFVGFAFDGLYDALAVGRVDVLISALPVTPTQAGRVLYTAPYFNEGDVLVAPVDAGITSMDDLDGAIVAVEYGAGGDVEARAWQRRLQSLEVLRMPGTSEALEAVAAGEADAALIDSISALLAEDKYESLVLVDYVTEDLFAAAVRRDATELHAQLNAIIIGMLDDGTVDELVEQWF